MSKKQCGCGSYLFYVYEHSHPNIDTMVVVCIREESDGLKDHIARIKEKEVIDNV